MISEYLLDSPGEGALRFMGKCCKLLLYLRCGGDRQNGGLLSLTLLGLIVGFLSHESILWHMMSIDKI